MKHKKYILSFFLIFCLLCQAQKSKIITTKKDEKTSKTVDYFEIKTTNPTEKKSDLKKIETKAEISQNTDSIAKKMPDVIGDNLTLKKSQDTVKNKNPEEIQILVATSNVKVTRQMVLAYIETYKEIAKDEMVKFKIPASITLAQGILESGSGTGVLSTQANNHFGIKCHENWHGASVRYDDDVPDECFRKYDNPNKSFEDHSVFLKTRAWYNNLFKLPKDDYKSWARGLKKAGYATDVKYPEKLISIIESYNLTKFDNEVLGIEVVELINNKIPVKTEIDIPLNDNEVKMEISKDSTIISQPKNEILKIEKVDISDAIPNTYTVLPKEGLYSISKRFNKTIDELKKLNNLKDNTISIGQVLKIK
jgi:flagellum-specific peptidoglycan hydrolase FlgJ/LysM repeat protein